MNMYFREGDKEAYVSHTRVKLPKYKDELTLVLVYGLSEEKAMMLLTNKKVKDKRDVHQVVRQYIKRWRIMRISAYGELKKVSDSRRRNTDLRRCC